MTVYANLVDGELKGVYDLLPEGISQENMEASGFVKIVRDTTAFDPTTHRMSDFPITYTVENGQVFEHRELLEIIQSTPEEVPVENNQT